MSDRCLSPYFRVTVPYGPFPASSFNHPWSRGAEMSINARVAADPHALVEGQRHPGDHGWLGSVPCAAQETDGTRAGIRSGSRRRRG